MSNGLFITYSLCRFSLKIHNRPHRHCTECIIFVDSVDRDSDLADFAAYKRNNF